MHETSSDGENSLFVYYHQEDYLTEWLCKHGFEVIDLIRKEYPKNDGSIQIHMVFITRKI